MKDYSHLKGKEIKVFDRDGEEASGFVAQIDKDNITIKGNWIDDHEDAAPINLICLNKKTPYFANDLDFYKKCKKHLLQEIEKGLADGRTAPQKNGKNEETTLIDCAFE